ncbi:GatB/YqeY domain-containing protein [Rubeoparvulum massiliense]|uniref:GatB/YqeY domain-containing protein n=1 Tax=Rubeoparvulum massiliense TaxID=1631346 RepID=UPI00065DE731|nr:GatB/YqeY domain-containing protein [Rubeoparvulum massiliense]
MDLQEQLSTDMKEAMKAKDKTSLSVIRMIRSALKYDEIQRKRPLTDDEALAIVVHEMKLRRDSLQEYEKAGRDDLVEQINEEMRIIEKYLPKQMDEEELRQLIQATIASVGATSKKEMGKVMGAIMPKVKGRADGTLINRLVQEYLQ